MSDDNVTATELLERNWRPNHRRRRAQSVAHAVHNAIKDYLADDERAGYNAMCAIENLLMDQGIEVLTDYDREQMGLPPRGSDGWTEYEIKAMEHRRLELFSKPLADALFPAHAAKPTD